MKDRRLGTDRRRSRQRTVFVSDVSYATVYLVRNALAGIERATCSTERLAVRTASCGSRRERFAARRVGEHVSSDVSLCTSYRLTSSTPQCPNPHFLSRGRKTLRKLNHGVLLGLRGPTNPSRSRETKLFAGPGITWP